MLNTNNLYRDHQAPDTIQTRLTTLSVEEVDYILDFDMS